MTSASDSLLPYVKYYSSAEIKKSTQLAFKHHPQFPALVDILSRKTHHHVLLKANFSSQLYPYFLEAFVLYLTQESIPAKLRGAEMFYLGNNLFTLSNFKHLLDAKDQYVLFVLSSLQTPLPSHPHCRFIIFTDSANEQLDEFCHLTLLPPQLIDILQILKQQRDELEQFHHVLIPEELLLEAYELAKRYLNYADPLKEALLLLDSSAARLNNGHLQTKPVVTLSIVLDVLAHATHIPASHLHVKHLPLRDFEQTMQQKIIGQEAAISILRERLKQTHAFLQQPAGPLGAFLFAGPHFSGKKTAARALSKQLFGHSQALFFVSVQKKMHSLADLRVQRCADQQFLSFYSAIKQTPYGIFVFDDIEKASQNLLDELENLLRFSECQDSAGNRYYFQQAIVIFTTSLGTANLQTLVQTAAIIEETEQRVDLIHLIMNERKAETLSHHYANQEITDALKQEILLHLPSTFVSQLTLVPFLPLNRASIDKILHLQLKSLSQTLKSRYDIELSFAPEIIHYLLQEANKHLSDKELLDPEQMLRSLYGMIEQVIENRSLHKNPGSNRLFLQLNETGQVLRCDWVGEKNGNDHLIHKNYL